MSSAIPAPRVCFSSRCGQLPQACNSDARIGTRHATVSTDHGGERPAAGRSERISVCSRGSLAAPVQPEPGSGTKRWTGHGRGAAPSISDDSEPMAEDNPKRDADPITNIEKTGTTGCPATTRSQGRKPPISRRLSWSTWYAARSRWRQTKSSRCAEELLGFLVGLGDDRGGVPAAPGSDGQLLSCQYWAMRSRLISVSRDGGPECSACTPVGQSSFA